LSKLMNRWRCSSKIHWVKKKLFLNNYFSGVDRKELAHCPVNHLVLV
jgi:hypothetical protein